MDFNFTPEQQQFSDALRRWVDRDYSFEQRKHIITSAEGYSDAAWNALVELGVTALPVPEEYGGFNGSAVDMMVVMHEIGRGLVVEPYFSSVVGAEFLKGSAHAGLLAQIAEGKIKLASALQERHSRHELFNVRTSAIKDSDGFRISGSKTVVLHGAQADYLIVSVRSHGSEREMDGISLLLLPANSPGIERRDYRTIDGQRAADIHFTNVHAPSSALLTEVGQAWFLLDRVADYAATLLCAEAVGAMEALNAATLEYLKTRQQFGVPIGKFQALQHRMAEMFMQLEQARSMAMLAAVKVSSDDAQERRRTVSAAKARIGQALKYVGQQAVQLHGGMGVTNELPAAHHFKRLSMIELSFGDTDHHLARFIAQPGFADAHAE